MKKLSILKTVVIVASALFLSLAVIRCTKTGVLAKSLNRSFVSVPDSGMFSSFYDSTLVTTHDAIPDKNDYIVSQGVKNILKTSCASASCHGGAIAPKFNSYSDAMKYVVAGNPQASKLWSLITTNDLDKAMPPVTAAHELSTTEKNIIYNWILNGAMEYPTLIDFRPAAIKTIVVGCGSVNCHNQATATGAWARKGGLIPGLTSADTTMFTYINPSTGAPTYYCQLSNQTLLNQVWTAYKDSVKKFYSDTLTYASFRPYKIFGTPISSMSTRGPLSNYDDILMDIMYPKSARSNSSVQYTDANGNKFYVKGNYLNVTSALVSRIDSTLLPANPFTGVFATNQQGDMAYGDGGLKPSEIALIKAWYFADPNIPSVWKYGLNNAGLFKYRKSGNIIKQ